LHRFPFPYNNIFSSRNQRRFAGRSAARSSQGRLIKVPPSRLRRSYRLFSRSSRTLDGEHRWKTPFLNGAGEVEKKWKKKQKQTEGRISEAEYLRWCVLDEDTHASGLNRTVTLRALAHG
jgi:hypothetical protein